MAGTKYIRWLYSELPDLVRKGVLGESQAEALKKHYGPVAKVGGKKVALVVFSIIGFLLIGLGIISLLAYNWAQLTRPARTFLAIAPLLGAQAYGFFVMRKKQGVAAREGAATFISLLFASAVAIVGQTYHIGGDLGGFLLTCGIFIIPLSFAMQAVMPAALYMGALVGWLGYERFHGGAIHLFWLLLVPVLIRYIMMFREDRFAGRTSLLGWVMALTLPICVGFVQEYSMDGSWIVAFAAVFSVMYLSAKTWFRDAESIWVSPFRAIGGAGVIVMSFMLTFGDFWAEAVPHRWWGWEDVHIIDSAVMLLPIAFSLLLLMPLFRKRQFMETAVGGMGVITAFTFVVVVGVSGEVLGMIVFNIYLLVLSIARIVSGLKQERVALLNSGMMMLGLLILFRFFEADIGFLAKGILCILLGSGFLTVNIIMLKKKKEVAQ